MTTEHVEPEALSAYLDGELEPASRAAVERHLRDCAECEATRSSLAAAAAGVASLPAVSMTADEHRALRKAVLETRKARMVPWAGRWLQWAAAGGLVLVAVFVVGLGVLRDGRSGGDSASEALTEAAAPESPRSFDFRSGDEVDEVVAALPEVAAGLNRYRPEDAPARQPAAASGGRAGGSGAAARAETDTAPLEAPAPATAEDSANQAPEAETFAGTRTAQTADFSNEAADACLQRVASGQAYPMVGLLARQATYQGTPAWLLVFAYSEDPAVGEPLDRWQTWIVTPEDCRNLSGAALADAALYRSFSGQT